MLHDNMDYQRPHLGRSRLIVAGQFLHETATTTSHKVPVHHGTWEGLPLEADPYPSGRQIIVKMVNYTLSGASTSGPTSDDIKLLCDLASTGLSIIQIVHLSDAIGRPGPSIPSRYRGGACKQTNWSSLSSDCLDITERCYTER